MAHYPEKLYRAMFCLLSHYYRVRPTDGLGAFLGSLNTAFPWRDGKPADPALGQDWQEVVNQVLGEGARDVPHTEGLRVVKQFVDTQYHQWGWDIAEVVVEVTQLLSVQRGGYLSWDDWGRCIRDAGLEPS